MKIMVHNYYNQSTKPPEREKQEIKCLIISYIKGLSEQLHFSFTQHKDSQQKQTYHQANFQTIEKINNN